MESAPRGTIFSADEALAVRGPLAGLASEVGESYEIRVDGHHPCGQLRYIATAWRLGTHPYAVITADPAELRAALAPAGSGRPPTCGEGTRA
jgi:hypothetical protein